MVKIKALDVAEFLDTPEVAVLYLTEALMSGDPAMVAKALGTIARSHGMAAVAEKSGLSRENLYRALSGDGNPEFATVIKVLDALDISLVAQNKNAA